MTGGAGGEVDLGSAVLRLHGDRSALDKELEKLRRYTDLLERQGIQVKFDANTGDATREVEEFKRGLIDLRKVLETVQRALQFDGQAWQGLAQGLQQAAEGAKGGGGALAGMAGSLGGVAGAAAKAIPILGEIGLAAMGLQAIFQGVTAAVQAVLAPLQALGREAGEFNKQVAEASIFTAQAFAVIGPDGKAIDGTANQMRALRGRITTEFKAIQKEVAQISGATSRDVYAAFNIISQNNSGLGKAGEDLANISKLATRIAAAMNTLNIPGDQLMSETMSLMTGQVQVYDQLATKIYGQGAGERIRQLQAEGKFYDDLLVRLNKLYDGQKVLAASMQNVQSNFQDVWESVNAEGGQSFERGLARAFQAVLNPYAELKNTFADMLRSVGEALEPVIVLVGQLAAAFVPVLSALSSCLQIVADLASLVTNLAGSAILPMVQWVLAGLTSIAKVFQLLATLVSAVLRPISLLLRITGQQGQDGGKGAFDRLNKTLDSLIEKSDRLSATIARPFLEAAKASAWLEGKVRGISDKRIAARQADIEAEYANTIAPDGSVSLRSITVSPLAQQMKSEADQRYAGVILEEKQLGKSREIADLKQRMYQNEIAALDQALKLLNAQRAVQQGLFDLAEARRGIETKRAEFSVSLASSPEARRQAEDRRNELAASQEQQRIRERVAALQTERQIQQQQLEISIRQAAIQQEQLKIQQAEIRVQQIKVRLAAEEFYRKSKNAAAGSPEQRSLQQSFLAQVEILGIISQQLGAADRATRLAFQGEANLRRTAALDQRRLDLQQESLGVQAQSANLTIEQQRTMSQLAQREQAIKNDLQTRTNLEKDLQRGRQQEIAALQRQQEIQSRLESLEKSRAEITKARADAATREAERGLAVAKAQSAAMQSPTSVEAVIGAQIEALALGRQGFANEVEATRALYERKNAQLLLEQSLARQQQKLQHDREASEQRIALLQLEVQRGNLAIQIMQLEASEKQLRLNQELDRMSATAAGTLPGAPSAPTLPTAGGGAARFGSTGNVRNAPGWVHGHFQTNTGSLAELVSDTAPVVMALIRAGVPAELADGFRFRPGMSAEEVKRALYRGARLHRHSGDGRSIDVFVPEGTAVPVPLGNVGGGGGRGGIMGDLPGSGKSWVGHLAPSSRSSVIGAAGTAAAPASGSAGTGSAVSIDNSLQDNASELANVRESIRNLNESIKELRSVQFPSLQERQANEREALGVGQSEQREAAAYEQRVGMLRAQFLATPRGRFAAGVTESTVGGIGTALRGGLTAAMQGGDVRQAMSQALATAAERTAQIALDAILNPLERLLTETLFKGLSGFDVRSQAAAQANVTASSAFGTHTTSFGASVAQFAAAVGAKNAAGTTSGLDGILGGLFGGGGIDWGGGFGIGGSAFDLPGLALNPLGFARNGGILTPNGMKQLPAYSAGGVARGSSSGYPAILHGTEAVIPMPNGKAIGVEIRGGRDRSAAPSAAGGLSGAVSGAMAARERNSGEAGPALADAVNSAMAARERNSGAGPALADAVNGALAVKEIQYQEAQTAERPHVIQFERIGSGDLPFITEEEFQRRLMENSEEVRRQARREADQQWRSALRNDTRIPGLR